MKSRTRKLLSLLLATAMVFTMNTFAFGEEASPAGAEIFSVTDITTNPNATEDEYVEQGRKDAAEKKVEIAKVASFIGEDAGCEDGYNGLEYSPDPVNDLPGGLDEVLDLQDDYDVEFFTQAEIEALGQLLEADNEGDTDEGGAEVEAADFDKYDSYEAGYIQEFYSLGLSSYYDAYLEAYNANYRHVPSTKTNASISANVDTWYAYCDEAIMAPYFLGVGSPSEKKAIISDHIVNGKPVSISINYGGSEGGLYGNMVTPGRAYDSKAKKYVSSMKGTGWNGSVSSNVFKLEDGKYLIVAYKIYGAGYNKDNGTDTNVPMADFNGKKFVDTSKIKIDKKTGHEKLDKTQNCDIYVEAAIVTQEAGKAPVLVANSLSKNSKGKDMIGISVKPKNNQYANVSKNATIKGGHVDITAENPSIKSGARPFFTISVKLDKDLKDYKKLLKKASGQKGKTLAKEELLFDIARNQFAVYDAVDVVSENDIDGNKHYDKFIHTSLQPGFDEELDGDFVWREVVTEADKDSAEWRQHIGYLSLYTDAKKLGKNKLPVYLINGTGDYVDTWNGSGFNYKGSYSQYKLSEKKDYTVESLGTNILLLKPAGNFEGDGAVFRSVEYTVPAGYSAAYKKDTKVTEIRAGVYDLTDYNGNKSGNWYVDSVE